MSFNSNEDSYDTMYSNGPGRKVVASDCYETIHDLTGEFSFVEIYVIFLFNSVTIQWQNGYSVRLDTVNQGFESDRTVFHIVLY